MSKRPHPLLELTRARILEFVREPGALFWVFVFPVLLAVGLGVAFRAQPDQGAQVAVTPPGAAARRVLALLGSSKQVDARLMRPEQARQALRHGRVVLVVRPQGPERGDARPVIVFELDPQRPESRAARNEVEGLLQRGLGRVDVATIREERVSERGGRYIDFLIPGLIGLNLMSSGLWGIGFVVVQARTRKQLKRFAATPMRRSHYLLSFMFSRLFFLVAEVAALICFGALVFDVQVRGSLLSLSLVALVGALSFSGLAMLIAARPQSIEAASGWMNFIMLPMWLLSGSFFSYERFPELLQPAIRVLPLTALNDALRAVINDGASMLSTWPQLLNLGCWGAISFVVALRLFRWQ